MAGNVFDDVQPGVIFLLGPTASGKSALAVALAERLPLEIVSVDSAMVYRGLDIGTAKPDAGLRARVPHALIDICDPAEVYSVAEFRRDALVEIERIQRRGHHALLVGGTSLYFRALEYGLSALPGGDQALREQIQVEARSLGWPALHARLAAVDPARAVCVHQNDHVRIERALEIYALTGRRPSEMRQRDARATDLSGPLCKLSLVPGSREQLYSRINDRFHAMIDWGLLEEVENLYARRDLSGELPAVRAVGYRQLWRVLAGEWSLNMGIERAIVATRQLAKRQLTWLRQQSVSQRIEGNVIGTERTAERAIRQTIGLQD